jgi:hypothetical protein
MRRPVRSHIGFVRQPVGIHDCAVIAPKRLAIDEKGATAVAADLTESDGRNCLALTWGHNM